MPKLLHTDDVVNNWCLGAAGGACRIGPVVCLYIPRDSTMAGEGLPGQRLCIGSYHLSRGVYKQFLPDHR